LPLTKKLREEKMTASGKTFIVEHLDPELGPWSELEYLAIARETQATQGSFILSSLPPTFQVPTDLASNPAFTAEQRGVEELYAANKSKVCLLDPSAAKDLSPEDGETFDAFLFGGILGMFVKIDVEKTKTVVVIADVSCSNHRR
jgi:ribosome biogenesis SPOUT family RNA methylase Rps3